MTGSSVDIDEATYQVHFKPNMAALVYENIETIQEEPSSSSDSSTASIPSSGDEDVVVGDVKKKKTKKKNRFGLSLPSKLKKKLKSRTNKKLKGKSKIASLLSKSAIEPSTSLIQLWMASGYKKLEMESSGSLFAGRLEDEDTITKLPTICEESPELKEVPSPPRKSTQNLVVEERKQSKKTSKWKLVKRFLKKKFKKTKSSQSSLADTASTSSSPRNHVVEDSYDAIIDDTEAAVSSEDDTFFSIPSEPSITTTDAHLPLPSSSSDELPPSLTLVQQPSSHPVARQASRAANFLWNGCLTPQEVDYPSDEEDSSVDSIVSPVPSPPASAKEGSPRKKILNYKKASTTKANKKKTTQAPVVAAAPKQTTTIVATRWNVWALLLAGALCVVSVWQRCFGLPRELVAVSKTATTTTTPAAAAALVNSVANISFLVSEEEENNDMNKEDSEWPYDECLLSKTPVSFFDQNGVLDCPYDHFFF